VAFIPQVAHQVYRTTDDLFVVPISAERYKMRSLAIGADDLDARGRSPMCHQSSRPSLGREAGGRSLGFIFFAEGGFGCPSAFGVLLFGAAEAKSIGVNMSKGTVKWFNSQKGYGFIQPQGGGKDVFVHISAVERAGLSGLNEGQVVEYEEVSNRGKTSAENLRVQR